jgi:DNA-binding beta-propeller fold protein YncE
MGNWGTSGRGAGTGPGQFQIPSGKVETHAFGVDPTDNSVYVGDEPIKGEYRIQKFSATGQFIASVSFKPVNPIGLEGIAVDPVKERVYALAVTLVFVNGGCVFDRSKIGQHPRGSGIFPEVVGAERPAPRTGWSAWTRESGVVGRLGEGSASGRCRIVLKGVL